MKSHKIKIKPTVTLDIEMVVQAETKNQAITKAEAYVIKQIANAFGSDPSHYHVKFGD